jgi:hypothetical protein
MKLVNAIALVTITIFGSLAINPILTVAVPDMVETALAATKALTALATLSVVLAVAISTVLRIVKGA